MRLIASKLLLLLLFVSVFWSVRVSDVKADGTIYIRADGSIDPVTANITSADNATYMFTDNNYDAMVVESDNILLDGQGYLLQGTGSGWGVTLSGRSNITLRNLTIKMFSIGVYLSFSSNNTVTGNTITSNSQHGVYLSSSNNNTISGNNITTNSYEGIWIISSVDTSITGNTITAHNMTGIRIDFSSNLSISSNVLADNLFGIDLDSSSSINISGNYMVHNGGGVGLRHSHNTTVLGNTLESCWTFGVNLQGASFNTIAGNNITNTINYGLFLDSSSNNTIYNNNFVNNSYHALLFTVENVNSWDSGYPGGGNYWSGYSDEDLYKGPQQNLTGRDGVWDHPYVIVTDIQDRYPLTTPFNWFPPGDVDSDRDVDIFDITQMAGAYGVKYPSTLYDRLCDLNLDGDVDIFDIVMATGNYGESW